MIKKKHQYRRLLITGGTGFIGSYVVKKLLRSGYDTSQFTIPRSGANDLRKLDICLKLTRNQDAIIHLAADSGGIKVNSHSPGALFYDNAMMGLNIIEAARINGVKKVIVISSIRAYPEQAPIPYLEKDLWNGYPEKTGVAYGVAKRILLTQAQLYRQQYGLNTIYLILPNVYGPGSDINPKTSHLIPTIIHKFIQAKKQGISLIKISGHKKSTREFLYVSDAAKAITLSLEKYDHPDPLNIGNGNEASLEELVGQIQNLTNFNGTIRWLPRFGRDQQPKRLLNSTRAKKMLKFKPSVSLSDGLRQTVKWFLSKYDYHQKI